MSDRKDNTETKFDPEIYEFEKTNRKPQYILDRYSANRLKLQIGLFEREGKNTPKTKSLIDKAISLAEENLPVSDKDIDDLHREIFFNKQEILLRKMEKSEKEATWVAGIELSQPKGDRD